MLTTSIFSPNGSIYHQSAVFGDHFQLNRTALNEVGLPVLSGSNIWSGIAANLSVRVFHMKINMICLLIRKSLRSGV